MDRIGAIVARAPRELMQMGQDGVVPAVFKSGHDMAEGAGMMEEPEGEPEGGEHKGGLFNRGLFQNVGQIAKFIMKQISAGDYER